MVEKIVELKPCPLCGGEATTSWKAVDPNNEFYFGWIGCQKCRCFINYVNNNRGLDEAVETWNRRTNGDVNG